MTVSAGSVSVPGQVNSMGKSGDIVKQTIYEQSVTQNARLGARLEIGDGRVFHYARNGGVAIIDGVILQGAVPVANHLNCTAAASAAIGDKVVKLTLGATLATANQYAEGYVHFNDEIPEGSLYKIAGHAAVAQSGIITLNLYDPLVKAVVISSSQATLTKNPYDGLLVAPNAALTQRVVGVSLIDVDINYYFWAQTWGPCVVLVQGTLVIGMGVGLGGSVDGAVGPIPQTGNAANDTAVAVGTVMQVNASTEYALIDLRLAP